MKVKKLWLAIAAVLILVILIPVTVFAFEWSPPVLMGYVGRYWDTDPEAGADDNGNVYVIWAKYPLVTDIMFNWFNGESWGSPERLNPKFNNWRPDIYVEPEGTVHTVWINNPDGIVYRRRDGQGWSSTTPIGFRGWDPKIVVDGTGEILVFVSDSSIIHGDGINWSIPKHLPFQSACKNNLGVDHEGIAVIAYCTLDHHPAYRAWQSGEWLEEISFEGNCVGDVEIYFNDHGFADFICESGASTRHWHQDASGWHGPYYPTGGFPHQVNWAAFNTTGGKSGYLSAIWSSDDTGEAYVAIWDGTQWYPAENVSNYPSRYSGWPSVAITSDDLGVAIFSQHLGEQNWILHASTAELVFNGPPTANTGGPYIVDEGLSISLLGIGIDPDADPLTFTWDLDNDGIYETPGHEVMFSAVGRDGPNQQTVSLQVCDDSSACDTDTTEVAILNVPPDPDAGSDVSVYRFEVIEVNGNWVDPAGSLDEPYYWTWDLDGDGLYDSSGYAPYGTIIEESTSFDLEDFYTLGFSVTDDDGGLGTDTITVEVLNQPPVCHDAVPSLDSFWPPNHEFVSIEIFGVTDPEGDDFFVTVESIFQDEAVNEGGDGNTEPDGQGVGTSTAEVRAERSGSGNGRVYHIVFTADDGHGGGCTGELLVGVPMSQGENGAPVDDGPLYDSTIVHKVWNTTSSNNAKLTR